MKKILAMLMATSMLTSVAVAADYIPGGKIELDGTESSVWEGDLKAINSDNYSVSSTRWNEGKDMVASVKIDDTDDVLRITLKTDYKTTKEKDLKGTVKLREKGKSNYVTATINTTVGYNVVDLLIDADGDVDMPTIDSGDIYRIKDNGKSYGELSFSAEDTDVTVRVYDGEVYYLAHNFDAHKNVLTANADRDATIDFLNFEGTPTFNSYATVNFYGVEEDGFIYELKGDKLVKSAAKWDEESDSWELKTRTLGNYVFSDKALKSTAASGTGSTGTGTGTGNEQNPDTGANDMVGVATALALTALASAAAVTLKKQK